MSMQTGRMYEPTLTALAKVADGLVTLCAPAVGLWRDAPMPGTLIRPGTAVGRLEVLGVLHRLVAPDTAFGVVVPTTDASRTAHQHRARKPVAYGTPLATLDPDAAGAGDTVAASANATQTADGLVFRASTGGRFYGRPAPDRDAFVKTGDVIEVGQTVCLLEVMKTFHRVSYGGASLPERARVIEVVPDNEQDLAAGDAILILESA